MKKNQEKLCIGLSEMHGIAQECASMPLDYVSYIKIESKKSIFNLLFQSDAKGVLDVFNIDNIDLIEASLFPVLTNNKWIYTPADTASAMAFNLFGLPTPRFIRALILRYLFSKKNFKALLFKSEAGLRTLEDYPLLNSKNLRKKSAVVYPAVREIEDVMLANHDTNQIQLIFVGEFFRKGGKEVVDAFIALEKVYSNLNLVICADREKHFNVPLYRDKYLDIIDAHEHIELCFVDREELFTKYLSKSHIFLCPTFQESFGYAILEAMAFGLPVVSTDYFAIPEMVSHNESGYTINIKDHAFIQNFKGYTLDEIPVDFSDYMKNEIFKYCSELISDSVLRKKMSQNALSIVKTKFSFENRNASLDRIYKSCFSDN